MPIGVCSTSEVYGCLWVFMGIMSVNRCGIGTPMAGGKEKPTYLLVKTEIIN